jgi:hypothetical protein
MIHTPIRTASTFILCESHDNTQQTVLEVTYDGLVYTFDYGCDRVKKLEIDGEGSSGAQLDF